MAVEKILKIKVEGDSTGIVNALAAANKAVEGTEASVKSISSAFNKVTETYTHTIEVAAAKLSTLRAIADPALNTTLTQNLAAEERARAKQAIDTARAKQQQLAAIARQQTTEALSEMDRRVALETSIATNGENHIRTIQIRSAQAQVEIRRNLAAQLAEIDRNMSNGVQGRNARGQFTSVQGNAATLRDAAVAEAQRALIANNVQLRNSQDAYNRSLDATNVRHRSLAIHILEIVGIYRVWNSVINTTLNSIRAIPNIGIQLEATRAVLMSTVGSNAGMVGAMTALTEEAQRTGIEIATLRENFRTFQASTSLAGETLKTTWGIFTNLNTVITALHLPADKANGIFLAMAQIFNKSKVQSEELVKQLGNLIPGAFASFATSVGKSTEELIKQMKKGEIYAHENVDKFATFLAKRFGAAFGAASTGLNATTGKMQTSFTLLGESIYNLVSGPLISLYKGITSVADALKGAIDGTNNWSIVLKGVLLLSITAITRSLISMGLALVGASGSAALAGTTAMAGGLATVATQASLAARAMSFLLAPASITAGLVVGLGYVLYKIREIANAGKDAQEVLDEMMSAAAKKAKEAKLDLTKAGDIEILVGNDEGVVAVTEKVEILDKTIKSAQERLAKLQQIVKEDTTGMNPDFSRQKDELARLQAQQEINLNFLKQVRDAARLEIEKAQKEETDRAKKLGTPSTEVDTLNTKGLSAAITKEKELLKQRNDYIDQHTKTIVAKFKAQQDQLDFNQENKLKPENKLDEVTYIQKRLELTNKINTELQIANEAKKTSIRLSEQHLGQLDKERTIITKNKDDIYKALRQQESSDGKNLFGGSRADPSLGPMQVTLGAWKATGKSEVEFTKATYGELQKAGEEYFESQLTRFKDLHIAFAAYNQGPGSMAAVFKKAQVEIGSTNVEDLAKVKAKFTPLMSKYDKEVTAKLPTSSTKIENVEINFQTELNTLKEEGNRIDLEGSQARVKAAQEIQAAEYHRLEAVRTLNIEVLESQGSTKEANLAKLTYEYTQKKLELEGLGINVSTTLLDTLYKRKAIMLDIVDANTKLSELDVKRTKDTEEYNAELAKINTLVTIGAMSSLNAAIATKASNLKDIEQLEQKLALEKEIIETTRKSIGTDPLANKAFQAQEAAFTKHKNDLENLKLSYDTVAQYIETRFASAFDNAFAGFVSGTMTATEAFKSFATSIVSELAKILAQEIRIAAVKGVLSLVGSAFGGHTNGGLNADGIPTLLAKANANGNVYNSSGLSAYSGSVVASPTIFPFARGIGLMGEAGPEAILPLKRGKDGKLGISSENSGQSNGNVYNITVAVTSGKGDKPSDTGDKIAQSIIRAIAKEEITKAARPGNSLNRTTAFG